MRVKIQNGTPANDGSTLCATCRFATIIKGRSLSDEIIECAALSISARRITFVVTACNEYDDCRIPSRHAMEDIGWVLRTDPKRHTIGFVTPGKFRRLVMADEDD